MNRDIIAFTKYKFNVYGNKDIRSGKDSAVVGIVGKSKSLDFPTMLIFWSLVRNSVVLAVYLLFSVACFLTVHEHKGRGCQLQAVGTAECPAQGPGSITYLSSPAVCLSKAGRVNGLLNRSGGSHRPLAAAEKQPKQRKPLLPGRLSY